MITTVDCLPCMLRQAIDAARLTGQSEERLQEFSTQILSEMIHMDPAQAPPTYAAHLHRMVRHRLKCSDPFAEVKAQSNRLAQSVIPAARRLIQQSSSPFETAVRLAIGGNIIDYGATTGPEDAHVLQTLRHVIDAPLPVGVIARFEQAVKSANRILYIGDNAGEVFFDRELIALMPTEKLTFSVRGGAILNDITMADAELAGITQLVEVIDNGFDGPGCDLPHCSETFRRAFAEADLIISKGQGNLETLHDVSAPIAFLFMVKCPVVSRMVGLPIGSLQLMLSEVESTESDLTQPAAELLGCAARAEQILA